MTILRKAGMRRCAYYVEATITKRVAGTVAALGAVQIVGGCII